MRIGDDLPVDHVSFEQAQAFCARLSEREGRIYRLPTEAEWAYACRAGTTTPFAFGETISSAQANFDGTYTYGPGRVGQYRAATMPVASFPPNRWGLHDMHGNVWEWCNPQPSTSVSATSFSTGSLGLAGGALTGHILRGGSWRSRPSACRSANRVIGTVEDTPGNVGFRVVMDAE